MIEYRNKQYREFRCSNCRALLGLEYIYAGRISVKCHVCNTFNDIECSATKKLLLEQSVKSIKLLTVNDFEEVK